MHVLLAMCLLVVLWLLASHLRDASAGARQHAKERAARVVVLASAPPRPRLAPLNCCAVGNLRLAAFWRRRGQVHVSASPGAVARVAALRATWGAAFPHLFLVSAYVQAAGRQCAGHALTHGVDRDSDADVQGACAAAARVPSAQAQCCRALWRQRAGGAGGDGAECARAHALGDAAGARAVWRPH